MLLMCKPVADFARKTGDYAFLSAVDLRVLALVYTLEAESKGSVSHLRTQPQPSSASSSVSSSQPAKDGDNDNDEEDGDEGVEGEDKEGQESQKGEENKENSPSGDNATTPQEEGESAEESKESEQDKEDDDDGWITPDNIGKVRAKRGQEEDDLRVEEVDIGCFTTDFAMQVRLPLSFHSFICILLLIC